MERRTLSGAHEQRTRRTVRFIVEDLYTIFVHLPSLVVAMVIAEIVVERDAALLLLLHVQTQFDLCGFLNEIL